MPANNAHQPDPESCVQLGQIGPTTLILIERSVANLSRRVMDGRWAAFGAYNKNLGVAECLRVILLISLGNN